MNYVNNYIIALSQNHHCLIMDLTDYIYMFIP